MLSRTATQPASQRIFEMKLPRAARSGPVEKKAISNLAMLNEAYHYAKPSSFSRGMRIDLAGLQSC